jgi:chaperonin GroEL (HSP60 family)
MVCRHIAMFLTVDMRELFVLDPLIGKRQQFLLATQLCRMILKVNDGLSMFWDTADF